MKSVFIPILVLLSLLSCKQKNSNSLSNNLHQETVTNHPIYVENIEKSHKKDLFKRKETICFNLDMTFGEKRSQYKIFTTPNSSMIKVEKPNGIASILKNGVFYTNADRSKWSNEKSELLTFHYFFMAPFKLSDTGTIWEKLPVSNFNNVNTNTSKLTFSKDTGETPDDWYIFHTDQSTNLIQYIGYIVTGGGQSQEEAEKHAHAIYYKDYKDVDGLPISHVWTFHKYDKVKGIKSELIGSGVLKNVLFMNIFEDTYDTSDLTKTNIK